MKRYILFLLIIFFVATPVNSLNKGVIDITQLTMSDELELLDKGVITSYELGSLYLDRINTYNDTFKAIITINPNVLEEAKEMDELRSRGKIKGRLHGVFIIVKDNVDVVGMPTTAGAKALSDNYPSVDAPIVKKLKDEGAIIIGKANMSEFAFSARDSNSSYGYVSNAFRVDYTSYGSSGGSAVAVALNFGSAAIGTDTNSSVRLPASAAGLVGLRPTYGKLNNNGIIAYDIYRDTAGILTKSVEDNALIMEVLTGEDYNLEIDKKIRIGVPRSFYIDAFSPIKEMFEEEIGRLEQEGIEIVYLDNYYGNKEASYNTNSVAGFTMCRAFNEYIVNTSGSIKSFKELSKSKGKISSLSGYYKSCNYSDKDIKKVMNQKEKLREHVDKIYSDYDLDYIMYPVTKNEIYQRKEKDKLLNNSRTVSSTIGYPSIVVPLGYYDEMPYGLELMGKSNEENNLYKIANLIEKHNNLINSHDSAADRLYVVDDTVKKLVSLYLENYGNPEKREWLNKVYRYFRSYNELDETEINAQLLIDEYYATNDNEDINDNDVKLIYGLSFLFMLIWPYSKRYIERRKRVNNILYCSHL
jgi:amidase